jgi:hypothetical protein
LSGYNSDFLFFIELLIKFHISIGDVIDVNKSFVLGQNLKELNSNWMECAYFLKSCVEQSDFFGANTTILGEHSECLGVIVQSFQVCNIFINCKQGTFLGCGCEKYCGISSFNSILGGWWLVVWN